MTEISRRVAHELKQNRKLEAIKLLREETGMNLLEAKTAVEDFLANNLEGELNQKASAVVNTPQLKPYSKVQTILGLGVFLSFVWLFINSIILLASIIILFSLDGYEKGTFTVSALSFTNNTEDGLQWSLKGDVDGTTTRLADQSLVDIKNISASKVSRKFPAGSEIDVLFNPDVTNTFFQSRSLNIILYTPDLASAEKKRIIDWIKRCLLPFVSFSLLLLVYNSQNKKGKFLE